MAEFEGANKTAFAAWRAGCHAFAWGCHGCHAFAAGVQDESSAGSHRESMFARRNVAQRPPQLRRACRNRRLPRMLVKEVVIIDPPKSHKERRWACWRPT